MHHAPLPPGLCLPRRVQQQRLDQVRTAGADLTDLRPELFRGRAGMGSLKPAEPVRAGRHP